MATGICLHTAKTRIEIIQRCPLEAKSKRIKAHTVHYLPLVLLLAIIFFFSCVDVACWIVGPHFSVQDEVDVLTHLGSQQIEFDTTQWFQMLFTRIVRSTARTKVSGIRGSLNK